MTLPHDFDFLCIDVDGTDYWLMHNILGGDAIPHDDNTTNRQIDTKQNTADQHRPSMHQPSVHQQETAHKQYYHYRPKVICIEFNPSMPNELIYIPPRSDTARHGSSLAALVELAASHEYVLIETTVFNAFFVPRGLYRQYFKKEVPDTSIEALHEVSMGTALYQLYDGTLKLHGCKKMLWHKRPLEEEKMQMLGVDEREFPFAPVGEEGCAYSDADANSDADDVLDVEIREAAIDMSSYCNPRAAVVGSDRDDDLDHVKRECFTKLNHALQTDGFALVKSTNVSPDICSEALRVSHLFLHEADEPVRRSCLTKDRARRGYSPMCTENFASLIGQRGVPNDLVKKFRVGPEDGNHCLEQNAMTKSSSSSLRQPNAWPSEEMWNQSSGFRVIIEEYYEQLRVAADCILRAICDGIIHENPSLEESMRVIAEPTNQTEGAIETTANHTSILTLLGYQPGSRHKRGSKGYLNPLVAAHTDVGMITVLIYDGGRCASLQRSSFLSKEGEHKQDWIDVNLPSPKYLEEGNDPVFVVNVGDCLSDLSGGYLRSTLHRVIPRPISSKDDIHLVRTSLALFVGLEEKAKLVLPSNEIMSYEEWRKRRIGIALEVIKN